MAGPRNGAYLLYNLLLYGAGSLIAPYVALRALIAPGFRRAALGRLGWVQAAPQQRSGVLVHGVSVGEVRAIRPLLQEIGSRHPRLPLVVSSTTPSGRQMARSSFPGHLVVPYPVDLPGACRRFLRRVRPRAVILMELEIWPNFLRACHEIGIPVAIVNGRITERSLSGYRRVQRLLPQFDRIRFYGVQSERYAARFRALAVPPERIHVTGNLKFDNLPAPGEDAAPGEPWSGWIGARPAVVLGSTHPPEEREVLVRAARRAGLERVLFLVAPRHPRRAARLHRELAAALPDRPLLLRSAWPPGRPLPDGAILIVDSFGELEGLYRAGRIAFVGGSLIPHGGQNVLEPAALGRPVLVGPHTDNFAEEVRLLGEAGALRVVRDADDLLESLCAWLQRPDEAASAGAAAVQTLARQRGAAQITLAELEKAGVLP